MAIWGTVFLVMVGAMALQGLLGYRQIQDYRRTIGSMARRSGGYLGVGVHRRRLRRGAVVALVADPSGSIVEGRMMTGLSVFARFQPYDAWVGLNVDEAMRRAKGEEKPDSTLQAAMMALEQIETQRRRKAEEEQA